MNIKLQQYRDLLGKYLRPQLGRVTWLGMLLVANLTLQLVNPQIMRSFLDLALAGGALDTLTRLSLLFIVIAFVQQLLAVGVTYVGENIGWTATNWLRYDLARHCLHLDMAFHNEHTPGEMIERVDGDINALSQFFSQFILQVLSNGLLLGGILILLFREAWSVGVALTLFVIITLLILNKLRNVAVPYWRKSRAASADFFSFVEERLAGMEDIRANGAQAYVMRRFYEILRTFWQTTVSARIMGFAMVNSAWVLFSIGTAVAFITGARLYQTGDLTLGTVYLIVHYTGMLSQPMQRIMQEMEKLQQAGAGVLRIQELLAEQSKIEEPKMQAPVLSQILPPGPLSCTFEHVTFSYAKDENIGHIRDQIFDKNLVSQADILTGQHPYVLHDLSFYLAQGRVLGLLGRTGSGKTTIARLLARLYDPDDGRVMLGGLDLRTLSPSALRRRVGIVTQNVQLFHATVRDNLTFFDETLPDAVILDWLDELGLARWYATLPRGLNTLLAPDGGGLSAGEAQLLAFARVFLKEPGLVILDEASSRLDPATEQLIERAVDRLLQNRTAIIIAHRLATVQRADEILILDQGRVLEHGSRAALAADPQSRFCRLLQTGLEEVLA